MKESTKLKLADALDAVKDWFCKEAAVAPDEKIVKAMNDAADALREEIKDANKERAAGDDPTNPQNG